MQIRDATENDLNAIVAMGAKFYATTRDSEIIPYDEASCAYMAQLMLETGVLMVAERNGAVVGMVGLLLSPYPFNFNFKWTSEVMWWVEPEHRDTGAGIALLRECDVANVKVGAKIGHMQLLANSPEHVAKLYEMLGYEHSATAFIKVY